MQTEARGPRAPDHGWMGDRKRGASLGRVNAGSDAPENERWTLQRVRLDSDGYDQGGAYWGSGPPELYWASCGEVERFFRASSRGSAKATIRREFPQAFFLR